MLFAAKSKSIILIGVLYDIINRLLTVGWIRGGGVSSKEGRGHQRNKGTFGKWGTYKVKHESEDIHIFWT